MKWTSLEKQLVLTLLWLEWSGDKTDCPDCMALRRGGRHKAACSIDAALTAAGLADQVQRNCERALSQVDT